MPLEVKKNLGACQTSLKMSPFLPRFKCPLTPRGRGCRWGRWNGARQEIEKGCSHKNELLGPARGLRIRRAFGLQYRRVLSFKRQPMWPPVWPTRMSYTIFSLGKAHGNDWKHDREAVKWEYNREAVNTDESPQRSETPGLG